MGESMMNGQERKLYDILVRQMFRKPKIKILKTLIGNPMSLKDLRIKTNMSKQLLYFHLNGNKQCNYEGMIEMGLVDCIETRPLFKKYSISNFGLKTLELMKNG